MSRASYLYKHLVIKGKHKNSKLSKFSGIVPLRAASTLLRATAQWTGLGLADGIKVRNKIYVLYLSSQHH
jgi:hypothetical protein